MKILNLKTVQLHKERIKKIQNRKKALSGISTNSTRRQRFLSTVTTEEVAKGKPKLFTFPPKHCLFFIINYF